MPFFFGGPFGRPPRRGPGWGRGRGFGPRRFWAPPPPMGMGMGYYPRRRRFYNNGRNSFLGALGLGALGFAAGRLFGGNRGGFGGPGPGPGGGFGGPGPGGDISGSGGADWGGPGGGNGSSGSFDAGGGGDWGQ